MLQAIRALPEIYLWAFHVLPERFEGTEGSVSNFFLSLLCNVSSARRDQMSIQRFCDHTTENASRLGYKHVCVNYLHVAYQEYQIVIQHTHTHTHTHTHAAILTNPRKLAVQLLFLNKSTSTYNDVFLSKVHLLTTMYSRVQMIQ